MPQIRCNYAIWVLLSHCPIRGQINVSRLQNNKRQRGVTYTSHICLTMLKQCNISTNVIDLSVVDLGLNGAVKVMWPTICWHSHQFLYAEMKVLSAVVCIVAFKPKNTTGKDFACSVLPETKTSKPVGLLVNLSFFSSRRVWGFGNMSKKRGRWVKTI